MTSKTHLRRLVVGLAIRTPVHDRYGTDQLMSDITDVIDHRRAFCLNEKRDSPHKNLFDEGGCSFHCGTHETRPLQPSRCPAIFAESATVMESDGDTTVRLIGNI